jgi:hypothetical protein
MDLVSDAERRKILIALPGPVDERLELLIRAARPGMQISRSQMVAALVAGAPTAPQGLRRIVAGYLSIELAAFTEGHPRGDLPDIRHPGRRRHR